MAVIYSVEFVASKLAECLFYISELWVVNKVLNISSFFFNLLFTYHKVFPFFTGIRCYAKKKKNTNKKRGAGVNEVC